eukprot:scaffold3081_cov112-Skeletonema_dohrnii-CCMP3373.AAC.6
MPLSITRRRAVAVSLVALCGALAIFQSTLHKQQSPLSSSSTTEENVLGSSSSTSRRQLSEALPNGGCKLTWPKKPAPGTPITYAASYPGCGARMTWNLVEALTGLETGDDWNNNGRGSEVVTVKTHFPQSNGILPDFDERIHRAFIVIRNPLESIPSFFNHIYEMRNHLPVHSERAPVEEWVKWRNAYVDIEIAEYKNYWMDRYTAENRHLLTYEGLTDDLIGSEVAKGLNEFLGQVEGVDPIEQDSVPCVWKAVVKNKPPAEQAAQIARLQAAALNKPQSEQGPPYSPPEQQQPALRRRLDPGHHDSQRKGPAVPRPYTPQQLDSMMNMLLEIGERFKTEDVRLYHIMMGYYEKVREARIKTTPDESVDPPPGGYF